MAYRQLFFFFLTKMHGLVLAKILAQNEVSGGLPCLQLHEPTYGVL